MNDDQTASLSPSGVSRRDAMLTGLLEQMTTMHRRRRRRRRAVAAFALLLAFATVAWIQPLRPAPLGSPATPHHVASNAGHAPALARVAIVVTDTSVAARFRAEPASLVRVVDDQALLSMLAEVGRPAGLIVSAGAVRLSAAVTDADLGLDQSLQMPETG